VISIGIDPGLHGAVVVLNEDFRIVEYYDCPVIKNEKTKKGKKSVKYEFAPGHMAEIIRSIAKDQYLQPKAWLERAGAMPKQGLSSTFKTGRGFGLWEGILAAIVGLPYDIIAPRTWSKEMFKGTPLGDPKQRSLSKAQRLFPELPLTKPRGRVLSLDGRSDAALIAYFGMLQMKGEEHKVETRTPVRIKKR
jgi:hypothetical protein